METYAYNRAYLDGAMTALATLLDYAVNYHNEHIDFFFQKFIRMGFAMQFERGNPDVVAGRSGVELYSMITGQYTNLPPYYATDRSAEFWVGWSLAYYQWYSNRTFQEITAVVKPSEMLCWYPTLHEADLMRFVDETEQRLKARKTNLEILRRNAGLSQSQLSELSGVSLRSIQTYEQRKNDLSKAQFNILNALATVLNCSVYDLMDSNLYPLYMSQPNTPILFTAQMRQTMNSSMFALSQSNYSAAAQANSLRLGYLNQFPYHAIRTSSHETLIDQQSFSRNWNNYWENIVQQQAYEQAEKQRRMDIVRSLAKEVVGMGIRASGNKQASLAYDTMCAITAPNLFEAVAKAISVITSAG